MHGPLLKPPPQSSGLSWRMRSVCAPTRASRCGNTWRAKAGTLWCRHPTPPCKPCSKPSSLSRTGKIRTGKICTSQCLTSMHHHTSRPTHPLAKTGTNKSNDQSRETTDYVLPVFYCRGHDQKIAGKVLKL